ncbi:MAG: hypothetical protein O3C39_05900 [Planctomycetota bacterium]|jgi:hypothetical protein|nr:hypothetical protein [Planctomycetota bacterium]MDA1201200.1 hypothetical protein [Planctomycetota bacterium]
MATRIVCTCGFEGNATDTGDGLICPACYEAATAVRRWQIACPTGHVHTVRENWLGRQMICPKCNEPFVPEVANSLEKRREQEQRQEREDAKLARKWLTISVVAAVLFVLLLIGLTVMSSRGR